MPPVVPSLLRTSLTLPRIEVAIRVGLFVHDGPNQLRMNGLSIYSRRLPEGDALCLLADTPPYFNSKY